MSWQKIIDLVFETTGHFFNIPPQFIIFLALASCLVVLFAGGVILHAMVHQKIGSAVSELVNRIIIIVLLWVLVPLFFWVINFTVVSIIHILLPTMIDGKSLANMVGSLGFTDNNNHQWWNYDIDYPDWNHYNLFLGAFCTWFTMAIFFLLGLTLVKRIFDLFLFYVVSPVIFATASSNVKWQKVNLWKEFVIGILIGVLGVGGFFWLVGWFFTNHHLFDIIGWIIAIPIIIILVIIIGFLFYIVCWLLTDLFKRSIKKVRIRNHKRKIQRT